MGFNTNLNLSIKEIMDILQESTKSNSGAMGKAKMKRLTLYAGGWYEDILRSILGTVNK